MVSAYLAMLQSRTCRSRRRWCRGLPAEGRASRPGGGCRTPARGHLMGWERRRSSPRGRRQGARQLGKRAMHPSTRRRRWNRDRVGRCQHRPRPKNRLPAGPQLRSRRPPPRSRCAHLDLIEKQMPHMPSRVAVETRCSSTDSFVLVESVVPGSRRVSWAGEFRGVTCRAAAGRAGSGRAEADLRGVGESIRRRHSPLRARRTRAPLSAALYPAACDRAEFLHDDNPSYANTLSSPPLNSNPCTTKEGAHHAPPTTPGSPCSPS